MTAVARSMHILVFPRKIMYSIYNGVSHNYLVLVVRVQIIGCSKLILKSVQDIMVLIVQL